MDTNELAIILADHALWVRGNGGVRANLRYANLRSANLCGADLRYANLRGANLSGADLRMVVGNCKEIKSLQCERWLITYTNTHLNIGCQSHLISEWWGFDDEKISSMDSAALEWWRVWKPILQSIISASPAIGAAE